MGDGPRATPTVSESRLFTFTGEGVLSALSTRNGEIDWSHNTVEELGGKPATYGMASSPLLAGDAVVVSVGAPQATVAAYSQQTGELLWTAGSDSAAGYSSPALISLQGRQQLVAFVGSGVLSIDPEQGDVLWQYAFETDYDCNIATPVPVGENLFISAGESHGCALLSVANAGEGPTVEEVWTSFGPRAVMRNEWQTSIHLDGFLYGFDNVGSAGAITHLACINGTTGEAAWKQLRFGKGNMIAADGKLWISNRDGELVIVRARPDGFEELDRARVITSTRQAPVLAGGRLYLRGDAEAVCIDIRDR
jgi:outer membrane protein assembly factor BamB